MDEITIRLVAIMGTAISLFGIYFTLKNMYQNYKLYVTNKLISEYIKDSTFFKMKNDGDDPCKLNNKITMPSFSQKCDNFLFKEVNS